MTLTEEVITIAMCVIGTMATRFLPFLIFREKTPTPIFVQYLGRALPLAIFAMLVVYSLKGVNPLTGTHGIPELIGVVVTIALHLWRGSMLISIAGGTVIYMALLRLVF